MSRGMTDKEYYNLALSIGKAINQHENPVKEKHVRSAIIGTFHEKSASTFWTCVLRLPLQDNRIVAWKFCHVLHKVLREGHPNCLPSSQRHKEQIENLGKLWCHLKESYGRLIQLYCTLLNTKLDFHRRNPRFPGNLVVTKEELVNIGENDINNYFQMSVEMFDYMDDLLNLQAAIFGSLDMSRSNSMTSSGQCRLAPLIPCIQDSSQLYDYCVKILFKLHATIDADLLSGHRERFNKQFRELRQFYINASTLQYFKNLIQIPLLPDNPPNFLVQSDLRSYVTPVVILPHESMSHAAEADSIEGSLIDTSDAASDVTSTMGDMVDMAQFNHRSVSPDVIIERDNTIQHLQQEILRLKNEIINLIQGNAKKMDELMERICQLETEVAMKDNELIEERHIKDELLHQTDGVYTESEKKGKVFEDKFEKLKDVYIKLRDEHVNLIRQKADVEKQLVGARVASQEAVKAKVEVEARLNEVQHEKLKVEETFAHSAVVTQTQLETLKEENEASKSENACLASKVDWVVNEKSTLENELQDLLSQKGELDVRLKAAKEEVRKVQIELEKENVDKLYRLLVSSISQTESIVETSMHEIDNPALSAVTCTPDYFQSLMNPLLALLAGLEKSFAQFQADPSNMDGLLRSIMALGHSLSNYMIYGKTTSNTSPDIEFGEHIAEACKALGVTTLTLLASLKDRSRAGQVTADVATCNVKVTEVAGMVERLTAALKGDSAEKIGDLVEDELLTMDKAIEEAAKRIEPVLSFIGALDESVFLDLLLPDDVLELTIKEIDQIIEYIPQEMLSKSRLADSGIKLEVNEKILDSCTTLMQAIRVLVQKSRHLQAEIVAQGKGTATAKEFYKRNHQWSEGLLSAAKAVAMGAKFLLMSADKVVSGQGKFEQLVVASQEIAASTAQLVVASRVKANRHSDNLAALSQASKGVTQATGGVVATAKSCSQMVEESEDLDLGNLSLHQAKRLEMESQVYVLELESNLQHERQRLSALRRHHYQLAGEVEGWEAKDMEQTPSK